jgi:hypothetical protein
MYNGSNEGGKAPRQLRSPQTLTKENEMKLTNDELTEVANTMADLDFGKEIVIEVVPEEWDDEYDGVDDNELYDDDGQPSEYDEWQDLYGGDDSIYDHDCDCMYDN